MFGTGMVADRTQQQEQRLQQFWQNSWIRRLVVIELGLERYCRRYGPCLNGWAGVMPLQRHQDQLPANRSIAPPHVGLAAALEGLNAINNLL